MEPMAYAPSLDGLRAVAILAVIGFHAMPRTFRGGFTGVDVFFVLSGYLITSVILHDIRNCNFSMREFYSRRILRLLPNAVLMVSVTLALYVIALLPLNAVAVAEHGLWALLNLSNVYTMRSVGEYWSDSAAAAPLLHTWSLAVEEQFYLAWPLALCLLLRRKGTLAFTVGLALASFALSAYATEAHPKATFYLLSTRAWEPLAGAVLGIFRVPVIANKPLRRAKPVLATEIVGWGGLAVVMAGFHFITTGNSLRGAAALVPAVGTLAFLLSVADGNTILARLLAKPFPVLIGKLSYSLYLWHWPMMVIGGTFFSLIGASQRAGTLVGLAFGVTLAVIAYRVVEHPFRQRGPGRGRRLMMLGVAFSVCIVACLGVSLRSPVADPLDQFDRPAYNGFLYDTLDRPLGPSKLKANFADLLVAYRPPQPDIWKSGGIIHSWGTRTPKVVVLGSSHAVMYARMIDDICRQEGFSVAFLPAGGIPVFFPSGLSQSFDAARKRWVREWNPDVVLIIDKWDSKATDGARFNRSLRELVGELAPHTETLILFSQVPALRLGETVNLREFVTWHLKHFGRLPKIAPDSGESARKSSITIMEAITQDFPKVQLLRVDPLFYTEDGFVRYSSGRKFFYADDDHLSDAGAELPREITRKAIRSALSRKP